MHQPPLYAGGRRPHLDVLNASLRYAWEDGGYRLVLSVRISGSTTWDVTEYGPLSLEEALDVLASSLVP